MMNKRMLLKQRGGGPSIGNSVVFFITLFLTITTFFSVIGTFGFFTGGVSILVEDSLVLFFNFFYCSFFGISSFLLLSDGSVHEKIDHDIPLRSSFDFFSKIFDLSSKEPEHEGN